MPHSQPTAPQQTVCKLRLDPQYHIFHWGSAILGDSTLCENILSLWRKLLYWYDLYYEIAHRLVIGRIYNRQVSRAWISYCAYSIMWDVITYACHKSLTLTMMDRQNGQTDGRTDRSVLRAAWSQLKKEYRCINKFNNMRMPWIDKRHKGNAYCNTTTRCLLTYQRQ